MTERSYRRGNLLIGGFVILLALGSVSEAYLSRQQDSRQTAESARILACVVDKFSALNTALATRGELAAQDAALDRRESALNTGVNLAFAAAAEHPEVDNQQTLIDALLRYKREIGEVEQARARVKQAREQTPIPPFPVGACDVRDGG